MVETDGSTRTVVSDGVWDRLGAVRPRGPVRHPLNTNGLSLPTVAFTMPTAWPTTGPPLAFLQLLLSPANTAFSGLLLLCVLDPTDELVAGQRSDVLPGHEGCLVEEQGLAQVSGQVVHNPAGHLRATHRSNRSGSSQAVSPPRAAGPRRMTGLPGLAGDRSELNRCDPLHDGGTGARTVVVGFNSRQAPGSHRHSGSPASCWPPADHPTVRTGP